MCIRDSDMGLWRINKESGKLEPFVAEVIKFGVRSLLTLSLIHILLPSSIAAEWQWSVQISGIVSNETNDHPQAFLWIPSDLADEPFHIFGIIYCPGVNLHATMSFSKWGAGTFAPSSSLGRVTRTSCESCVFPSP